VKGQPASPFDFLGDLAVQLGLVHNVANRFFKHRIDGLMPNTPGLVLLFGHSHNTTNAA
jgi:hypothetical protein